MSLFTVFAILITLTAIFSFINVIYIKLPSTVGVMLASLISSLVIIISGYLGFGSTDWAVELVESADFDHLVMNGLLSFLLFAAASRVDISKLREYKWTIAYLATVGIIISTLFIGFTMHWLFGVFGKDLPLIYAIIFGAIISPIDAVVVLKLLKQVKASPAMETIITGESLFNDAVAVVLFVFLVAVASGGVQVTGMDIGKFFLKEALGGLFLGLILGYLSHRMIVKIMNQGSGTNNHVVIVLITLALVSGGYTIAELLDVSGPLTSVVAGLFLAKTRNHHDPNMPRNVQYVHDFWDVIDEILNAVLFVLIGLEVLVLNFEKAILAGCILVIPITILARYISVEVPLIFLRFFRRLPTLKGFIMTWCGLRGGVSIALALSLPDSDERDVIIVLTYIVVVFSILVQGLTLSRAVKWVRSKERKV